ncbi:MAG: glycosyltransferase family 2 protein [Longimicrobiales bacterium]
MAFYTYAGYPVLLWVLGRIRPYEVAGRGFPEGEWPTVSISVPAYNEETQIRGLVESLLALDYPRDRLQILVVSDASSDQTDDIVAEYADRGVELLRMAERGGKTRAERAAAERIEGEIVVNTDASIRIDPASLKRLVAAFTDPAVGLASGRDVSVTAATAEANVGEAGYVGYEMAVRDLETRAGSIIGASGCFYGIRAQLHRLPLPDALSRDFAAALHTLEQGYRAVSVPDAVCYVPRSASLAQEYRRKVRTITRGIETLWHKRALLNPLGYGRYAWMLFSHKVCRWLLPWAALSAFAAVGVLAPTSTPALGVFALGAIGLLLGGLGWFMADRRAVPPILRVPAYVLAGNAAAAHALLRALHGDRDALWEPTRREPVTR